MHGLGSVSCLYHFSEDFPGTAPPVTSSIPPFVWHASDSVPGGRDTPVVAAYCVAVEVSLKMLPYMLHYRGCPGSTHLFQFRFNSYCIVLISYSVNSRRLLP